MGEKSIYTDIAERTQGDIYIGVVGPVRSGKSTFIKRFMDMLVLPNIQGEFQKERAVDELPQSAAGRTIMTTEPKFIPEDAVTVTFKDKASLNVRLIDCVGYIIPSAIGYIENNMPRMVKTPWFEDEIPFNMAAEIGTKKVITDHSTIGIVVTTDGSITDMPRNEYEEAEERVINELKEINKPFVVLFNCLYPDTVQAKETCKRLTEKYSVPVMPVNCLEMSEENIKDVLSQILFEFPVKEISVDLSSWVSSLDKDHWLRREIFDCIKDNAKRVNKIRDINCIVKGLKECPDMDSCEVCNIDLGCGDAMVKARVKDDLFYNIISETTGIEVADQNSLMKSMLDLAKMKKSYEKVKDALDEVEATGYGIVMPTEDELTLEEPEIMKQGGKYGVRLRASAPSIHMMKACINTEVTPIVGSEKQSEDLVMYLLKEFEEHPTNIWQTNMFGKSLHELVNEGLHNKLYRMPSDARMKLQQTIERVINEGCNGLICIIV